MDVICDFLTVTIDLPLNIEQVQNANKNNCRNICIDNIDICRTLSVFTNSGKGGI